MMHKIHFLTERDEVIKLYEYIKNFPLDYPNYLVWLEKCKRELELGYKKAFYTTILDDDLVGSIIFQPHKQEASVLEIKNLRVSPDYKREDIGSALALLVERYARKGSFKKIQVDTHEDNRAVIQFFLKKGFSIEKKENLYSVGKKEIVLSKEL